MTIGDDRNYIRVLLYSYYTTFGWGVLLTHTFHLVAPAPFLWQRGVGRVLNDLLKYNVPI